MISKTLGQLTQDETRLWESTFCSIWKGVEYRSKAADDAIAALRQYRAESSDTELAARLTSTAGKLLEIAAGQDPRDPPHEEDVNDVDAPGWAAFDADMRARATGSGIIGTYDPLNKGWWLNGPTIPRFEPDPRVEEGKS